MLINLRKILMSLTIISILLCAATLANSQTETPKISFAENSAKTAVVSSGENLTNAEQTTDCESELKTANQRLLKTLDALERSEKVIEAQKAEIAALKSLNQLNDEILAKKEQIIADQNKLIEKLEKQTRPEFKVFWGLVKIRF